MEWERDGKAAPGQRVVASSGRWFCSAPLAGLESEGPPARLHPPASSPARRNSGTDGRAASCRRSRAAFPCQACPLSSHLGAATGAECAPRNVWADHDPIVWRSRTLCDLPRLGRSVTSASGGISRSLFLGEARFSEWCLFPLLRLVLRLLLPSRVSALESSVSAGNKREERAGFKAKSEQSACA